MHSYSLFHVSDTALSRDLAALVAQDRATTAALVAHIAEFDARRLYAPAGHPSMFAYCVQALHFSEDAAYKRIQAARLARRFPAVLEMLADGRLHLSGTCLLAAHMTTEVASALLAAAARKSKAEIEQLLAERFPRPDLPTCVRAVPCSPHFRQLAPGQVGPMASELAGRPLEPSQLAPERVETAPQPGPAPRPRIAPLAPERYALQLTMGQGLHDKLRHAQELLSHEIPAGNIAQVLERALDALIVKLEQRRFAAVSKPREARQASRAGSQRPRHVPADVRRQVWARDQGRCTFVADSGHRCEARALLEFDHIEPVARGGRATRENIRLRCRAHNQYQAECAFGAGFMHEKRERARRAAAARQARAAAARTPGQAVATAERGVSAEPLARSEDLDVSPWLRRLGYRTDEVRRAAAFCGGLPGAALEERVRAALSFLRPHTRVQAAPGR